MRERLKEFLSRHNPAFVMTLEGGGSKTLIQILNAKGEEQTLKYQGKESNTIEVGGCNPNTKTDEDLLAQFQPVFEQTFLVETNSALRAQTANMVIFGGVAGVGNKEPEARVKNIFVKLGFTPEQIFLVIDADASLAYAGAPAIMLIAGTGMICQGTLDGIKTYRAGGYGPAFGDRGSGYYLGMSLLELSFDRHHGILNIAVDTPLFQAIHAAAGEHFHDPKTGQPYLKNNADPIIPLLYPINRGEIKAVDIAKLAPIALQYGLDAPIDAEAATILKKSASELAEHLHKVWRQMQTGEVVNALLVGGLFKGPQAAKFIILLGERVLAANPNIKVVYQNGSSVNTVTGLVKKLLSKSVTTDI